MKSIIICLVTMLIFVSCRNAVSVPNTDAKKIGNTSVYVYRYKVGHITYLVFHNDGYKSGELHC